MKKFVSVIFSSLLGFGVSIVFFQGVLAVPQAFVWNAEASHENVPVVSEPAPTILLNDIEIAEIEIEEEIPFAEEGIFMFRGNETRNFYGTGPIPKTPEILWRYPEEPMCKESTSLGRTNVWCGSGWTGQPVVWEREDGITEVIFGAYDGAIHFLDADTGLPTREKFQTGDIIKGSFTLDPDNYPLLYGGSRDNKLRIVALDQETPTELYALDSEELPEGIWNNDWDGNPLIKNDVMYVGGENGWFYAIKLNRSYDEEGSASVSPEIIFEYAGYDDEWIEKVDENLSIESSPLLIDGVVYIANSGGRIMGFDIKKIKRNPGKALVFDYWVGDDTDATLVTDNSGAIYVVVEKERFTERSLELGQIIKLDPDKRNPLVWSTALPNDPDEEIGGIWSTPAIYKKYLYITTHNGELLAVNKHNGEIVWGTDIGEHAWSSPSVVDETLIVATCETGGVEAYSLAEPGTPKLIWRKEIGEGCIEATPAIWKGNMYVGNRDGFFYKIGE